MNNNPRQPTWCKCFNYDVKLDSYNKICPSLISIANLKVCSEVGFMNNILHNLSIMLDFFRNLKSPEFNTFVLNSNKSWTTEFCCPSYLAEIFRISALL